MKMPRKQLTRVFTLATLVLCSALGAASKADTLDDIKARGTLVVGGKTDFAPFGFRQPDGKVVGFSVDLAQSVADKLGVKLEVVPTQVSNMIQFLNSKKIDVIIAVMSDTPERRKLTYVVDPGYYASGATVLIKKSAHVTKWEDLKGKTICGTQGAYFNKPVQETYGAELIAFRTTAESYAALKGGNCEGFLYDDGNLALLKQEPGWDDFEVPLPSILVTPAVAAVRLDDEKFHAFMADMATGWHKSGRILELEKKYFGKTSDWAKAMYEKYRDK